MDKYYTHTSGGGYNKCIIISGKSCLPNCVGFAYGRFMQMAKKKSCKLPVCNAEDWYANPGYKKGKEPKVGAVMCFRKGKVRNSADGCGHVLIVEKVYENGKIICSQSGYGCSQEKWNSTFRPPYKLSGYVFQGFIYNPDVKNKISKLPLPTTTIKKGSTGDGVEAWQIFLNEVFGVKILEDGDFGAKTEKFTKKFQKKYGLTQDGVVGAKTIAMANEVRK